MARRKTRRTNEDNYQAVTDAIVAALEKGEVKAWTCPWDRTLGMVRNGFTNRPYSGLNVFMLWFAGFGDPRFYTFNQVKKNYPGPKLTKAQKDAGEKRQQSHIRKGEKGTKILFWKFIEKKDAEGNITDRIPLLKVWTVFNHTQVEWAEGAEPQLPQGNDIDPGARYANAAALLEASGADVRHGGSRAYYSPTEDYIGMPQAGAFNDAEGYWATMLHELVHWTGHGTRCRRPQKNFFGTTKYAAEELVAEMGSAFLCAQLGIEGGLQHPEYIGSWIKRLQNDNRAIFDAARKAQEAVEFLLGKQEDVEKKVAA